MVTLRRPNIVTRHNPGMASLPALWDPWPEPNFQASHIVLFPPGIFLFNESMNVSLEHIGLPAKDSAALKAWYERVLGARQLWDNGLNPPTCLLSLGAVWVEIYPADKSRPETADNKLAGFRHLALRVASLSSARAELELRGVAFTEEVRPAAGGGTVLFFEDAEQNLLHLVERPDHFKL
jgi:catechol 2,3-dioxygenase-like lactoylglutathione lyase family enzyme